MGAWTRTESDDLSIAGLRVVVSQQGATTTIALEGEWDLAQKAEMRSAVHTALEGQPGRVVLDLSRLTFMDSTGVHGVLELASLAASVNIDLVVIPGPRAVRRLFELCQISDSLTFAHAGEQGTSRETPPRRHRAAVSGGSSPRQTRAWPPERPLRRPGGPSRPI